MRPHGCPVLRLIFPMIKPLLRGLFLNSQLLFKHFIFEFLSLYLINFQVILVTVNFLFRLFIILIMSSFLLLILFTFFFIIQQKLDSCKKRGLKFLQIFKKQKQYSKVFNIPHSILPIYKYIYYKLNLLYLNFIYCKLCA